MNGPKTALLAAATLAAAWLGAPAAKAQDAGCRLCTAPAEKDGEAPATPIRLEVRSRLDFDSLVFAGLGQGAVTVTTDGRAQTSGSVSATGARVMPGSVTIRGEPGRSVRIDLPRRVQLHGERGGVIEIDSLSSDLPALAVIGADGELTFRFGGILKLDGDLDGAFRGDVDILVDYL